LSFHTASANKRSSGNQKWSQERATNDKHLFGEDFFLLAIPIKPIRPEPKSQTAAGIGITEMFVTTMLFSLPISI
jgi:hypothetical protein